MRATDVIRPPSSAWRFKRTAMRMVVDVMTPRPVMVNADAKLMDALDLMRARGIVSDTDLFTSLVPDQNWEHARAVRRERAFRRAERQRSVAIVADLMSAPVLTVDPDCTVQHVVDKMVASGVSSGAATGGFAFPVW